MSSPAANIVAGTRQCFQKNHTKSVDFRLKNLKQFRKFLEETREEIIEKMGDDLRKHPEEARVEVFIALSHVSHVIDNTKKWVCRKKAPKRWVDLFDGVYIYNDPYGVVLIMGAWNVPLLTLLPIVGAIAAGNCVIIKPSHNCPKFSLFLEKTLPKYLDSTCYPVFTGGIEETNELLAQRFDYIYYTGSVQVGRIVHQAANKYLTPVTLELGGKNPVYIDPTSDIELATRRILWGKCFNSGQACIAPDYILCTKSTEELFVKAAKTILNEFFGTGLLNSCPIVNDHHFKRLERLLSNLEIVIGGKTDPINNYIEPTIAINVSDVDPIMQEEIFGPILPIITIKNHQEAIDIINAGEKPLSLYIFSKNKKITDSIIANTSSGGITVNDTVMHLLVESLPFGGVGLSGMGCYKGENSFNTFVHKKSVLIKNDFKILEKINRLRYPPLSAGKSDISEFLLRYRRGIPLFWVKYLFVFILGFLLCVVLFVFLD